MTDKRAAIGATISIAYKRRRDNYCYVMEYEVGNCLIDSRLKIHIIIIQGILTAKNIRLHGTSFIHFLDSLHSCQC